LFNYDEEIKQTQEKILRETKKGLPDCFR